MTERLFAINDATRLNPSTPERNWKQKFSVLRPALSAAAIVLFALQPRDARAQADQGAIVGVVTDNTGAVVAGADVTLTDIETGLVLKTKSNASGDYFFAPIKTGTYTVSASAPNFQTTEEQNIVVHVTDRLNIPLTLKPGKVSQTITVTSEAPLLQTQTVETAVDIDSQFLNDAPLANRNWIFIAQEAPGVTPEVGRGAGNGDFSSNGQHAEQNNYNLDGVDDNTVNSDYVNGSEYNLAPPPDAIAEFKLETNNYSAEIGRGHAAVINATTKSGTNQIHGDVWEYVRNTDLDALVWTQAPGSAPAAFHMNQFGATLGGPIIKNKLFLFGDIQEARYAIGATPSTYSVPTPRMRQGDFSEILNPTWNGGTCPVVLYAPNSNTGTYTCNSNVVSAGPTGTLQQFGNSQYTEDGYTFAPGQNVFNPATLDTAAQKILQLYPCPNYAPAGSPNFKKPNGGWQTGNCNTETTLDTGPTSSNYQVDLNSWSDPINWDGKLDWNISSRDLATFRIDYQHIINTNTPPLGPILDGTGSDAGTKQTYLSENYMISETHTFSPTLINVISFGFNFGNDSDLQANDNTNIAATIGLNGVPIDLADQLGGLPAVSDGFTGFGTHGNDPVREGQNVWEILDNVTKVVGNNSLKMGLDINPQRWYSTDAAQPLGSYSYSATYTGVNGISNTGNTGASFLAQGYTAGGALTGTDNMSSAEISTFTFTHFVQQYMAAYLQDDWKVTQKLTLNLGVRYEYFTPKREQDNQLANFVGENSTVTSNGVVGASELIFPQADQNTIKLEPNLVAILNADNVAIKYTTNPYLSAFPKANWSPRVGVAYQVDSRTVARLGAGIFMGGFEPGGGAANILNPPFIMLASTPSIPTYNNGTYYPSQYSFGNTLEGGLGGFEASGGIENYATFPEIGEEDPVMHMPYVLQYNVSVQRAITPTTTATVGWVGNLGRHLVTGINNPAMPEAGTIGGEELNALTLAPHFDGYFWMSWTGESNYNAMQATVQKHYGNGLALLGTYTWAHGFDDTTDLLGGENTYKNAALIPIVHEMTQSGYDIRQRAVIDVDYDLPFGVGRQFVNHPGVLDKIIGGWRTDMLWWGQTGEPINGAGIDRTSGWSNINGGLSNSAIKVANPYSSHLQPPANYQGLLTSSGMTDGAASNTTADVCAAKTKTRARWLNPCAYADPLGVGSSNNATSAGYLAPYETGTFSYASGPVGADNSLCDGLNCTTSATGATAGTPVPYVAGYAAIAPFFGSPKNGASGPGNWRLDASLFKDFRTWREQYLEFRADAFNVLNHPSFGNPSIATNVGTNSVSLTGTGSNQTNTIDARFFQLSAKYVF
jgi:Carboxypeptidase regulatory-like domain